MTVNIYLILAVVMIFFIFSEHALVRFHKSWTNDGYTTPILPVILYLIRTLIFFGVMRHIFETISC